mmetsp:Transcript_7860/g.10304  ORF Transcript_7860/g.10304 Transcript_7860/m.10304 type:complete len:283 (+) Transcript_7860:776-1624(+)
MQITFICQILSSSQSKTGRNNTLNGRVIGQVQEQSSTLHGTGLFKVTAEETGGFHVHTHGTKHDGKVFFVSIHGVFLLHQRGLTGNLSSYFIVRQTSSRENGNFLTAGDGVHDIDSRNTSLDHSLGVITRRRVNRLTIDIKISFSQYLGSLINHFTRTVEGATKHFFGNTHFQHISGKLALGFTVINTRGAFKNLHNGTRSGNLQDLTLAQSSITQLQVDNLCILGKFDIIQEDQRTIHAGNCAVFQTRNGGIIFYHRQRVQRSARRNEAFFLVGHGCNRLC